jgi:hypothetical protein
MDQLFAAWKTGFTYTGGCNAEDNSAALEALDWRDYANLYYGGTVSFTYEVWDDCSSDEVTCEFVIPECIYTCETAYGRLEDENGNSLGDCFLENGFNRWGWSNLITESEEDYVLPLYAGAAHCNPENGWGQIGTATISYNDGEMVVTYQMDAGHSLDEVHIYVGCEMFPVINGTPTVAPGQYTHNAGSLDNVTEYTVTFTDVQGPVYVIAHAVVCDIPGIGTVTGPFYNEEIDCGPGEAAVLAKGQIDLSIAPNPFVDVTEITFKVTKDTRVTAEIYDLQGRLVTTLFEGDMLSGESRSVTFKVADAQSQAMLICVIRTSTAARFQKILRMH